MGKLTCPECEESLKRKIVFSRGKIGTESTGLISMPVIHTGSHSYNAHYRCTKCDFQKQKYFKYVSGHPDFETGDMFTGSLAKYGVAGKTLVTLLIFGAPIVLLTILFGDIAIALGVFGLICVFGYMIPIMFIVCAWADHNEDMSKLTELDSEFIEKKTVII